MPVLSSFRFISCIVAVVAVYFTLLRCSAATAILNCSVSMGEFNGLHDLYTSTEGWNWYWGSEYNATFNNMNITIDAQWSFYNSTTLYDPCLHQWQGVTCTPLIQDPSRCNITELSLFKFNLKGKLSDGLFGSNGLSNLNYLTISVNHLSGTLPVSLFDLNELQYLYIDHNVLTGTLSNDFSKLSLLKTLELNNNLFEGPAPVTFSSIISLSHFNLYINSLSSTIPYQWSTLTNMQYLYIDTNQFTGSIPSQFSTMKKLVSFYCYSNHLSKSIPKQLSTLTLLNNMYFNLNHLTSTMPSEFSTLTSLKVMYFFGNSLTGTIPKEYSTLVGLKTFLVKINMLTGSIPNEFGTLTNLIGWGVGQNMLTGTIPSFFSKFGFLDYLKCFDNSFHGTLPSALSTLTNMTYFNIAANHMTGTLPVQYSHLKILKQMFFYGNYLSGTLPPLWANLPRIEFIYLGTNSLTGNVPSEYGNFKILENFDISNNQFKGMYNHPNFYWPELTFLNISYNHFTGPINLNYSNYPSMNFFDISHNYFTGAIPMSDFLKMKHLNLISLSFNCLDTKLDDSLCDLADIQTILLDKLGSQCISTTYKFFSPTASLPSCYWRIPSLETFHAIGNGLLGRLDEIGPKLTDIAIMSNLLTGTIPQSFQESKTLKQLILSFNRFSGTLSKSFYTPSINAINLTSNRLSGDIPPFLLNLKGTDRIDVIGGNLFMCDNPPHNDVNYRTYSCGSDPLTISGNTYGVIIAIIAIVIGFVYMQNYYYNNTNRNSASFRVKTGDSSEPDNHKSFENESKKDHFSSLNIDCILGDQVISKYPPRGIYKTLVHYWTLYPRLSLFDTCIVNWSTMVWHIVLAIFLICFNIGAKSLKKENYSTHTYQYGWLSGFGFSHGWGPVVVICIVVFLSSLMYFRQSIAYLIIKCRFDIHLNLLENIGFNWRIVVMQFVNIVIVCIANFFYIDVLANTHSIFVRDALPFILGFFKAVWGLGYIDFMMKNSNVSSTLLYLNELFATLFVFFISPLLLIAITEFNCYYYSWHTLKPVSVSFPSTITDCNTVCSNGICEVLCPTTLTRQTSSVTPPWIYGYQCGSSIILSYTPVVLNSYVIAGFIVPLIQILFLTTTSREFRRKILIDKKLKFLPLECLCCLTFSRLDLDNMETLTDTPDEFYSRQKDIRTSRYLATTARDIVMLMTFGIASPFIIFVVLFTLIMNDTVRRLQLGSFKADLQAVNLANEFDTFLMKYLYRSDLEELYKSQIMIMLLIVMEFWAIICYDMIADIYGNSNGLIAMFSVGLGTAIITIVASYYFAFTQFDDNINSFFRELTGQISRIQSLRRLSTRISRVFTTTEVPVQSSPESNDKADATSSNKRSSVFGIELHSASNRRNLDEESKHGESNNEVSSDDTVINVLHT